MAIFRDLAGVPIHIFISHFNFRESVVLADCPKVFVDFLHFPKQQINAIGWVRMCFFLRI